MVNRIQDFEIVPSDQALGAEVRGVDLAQPLSGELIHRIIRAWERYHVVFFRGQSICLLYTSDAADE